MGLTYTVRYMYGTVLYGTVPVPRTRYRTNVPYTLNPVFQWYRTVPVQYRTGNLHVRYSTGTVPLFCIDCSTTVLLIVNTVRYRTVCFKQDILLIVMESQNRQKWMS
jgi:hypothetical protein